ncbi:heptahelical transmembrane protein 2 [Nicotiana tabacum]|uniref:Heptahelical transmembrane protein 2 n=1 Tax=Nicotiana tabacum TaxID=4097 RepID=A0A1S3YJ72_TOBAC|nr:PREDICTED: heptahelical transmembrane protein 2-like [Nicotiana tabacum]
MKRRGGKKISKLSNGERVDSGDRINNVTKNGQKLDRRKLVKYEALPEYLQDNEFIRDYYRCEWPLKDIALSVFSWHNETLNIWTHLGGFVIFVTLTAMSLTEKTTVESLFSGIFRPAGDGQLITMKKNGSSDSFPDSYAKHISESILDVSGDGYEVAIWPWFVFLGGAMSCLICSTLSHLFACHSLRFSLFFWRLDYAGISIMIVCSFFCPIYYIFCSQPYWCLFYLTTITIFGILAIITLLSPALFSGRFRSFRATLFLAMGFSGLIPATHALFLHFNHPQVLVALGYEIVMGLLYATGAVFYMTRFPERCKPGAFDLVGHSHQIFHVFVVAAALAHCVASLLIMDWRRGWPTYNAGMQ